VAGIKIVSRQAEKSWSVGVAQAIRLSVFTGPLQRAMPVADVGAGEDREEQVS
jgi:hypothetical protein